MYGRMYATRALKFDSCDTKKKSGSLAQPETQSSVPELSYRRECVSYFELIISEVLKNKYEPSGTFPTRSGWEGILDGYPRAGT